MLRNVHTDGGDNDEEVLDDEVDDVVWVVSRTHPR